MDIDPIALVGACASVLLAMGGLLTVIIGFHKLGRERRKLEAETKKEEADVAQKIQQAASELMDEYKQQVNDLRCEVTELKARVLILETELDINGRKLAEVVHGSWLLYHQVVGLGKEPAYEPPELRVGG